MLTQPELFEKECKKMEAQWQTFKTHNPRIAAMEKVGKYSVVHLDFGSGVFIPEERD